MFTGLANSNQSMGPMLSWSTSPIMMSPKPMRNPSVSVHGLIKLNYSSGIMMTSAWLPLASTFFMNLQMSAGVCFCTVAL